MADLFLPLMASMRDRVTKEPVLSYTAFCRACRREKMQDVATQFIRALRLPHMVDAPGLDRAMQRALTLVFGAYAFDLYPTRAFQNVHARKAGLHARSKAGTLLEALRKLGQRQGLCEPCGRIACELHLSEFQDAWMAWRRVDYVAQTMQYQEEDSSDDDDATTWQNQLERVMAASSPLRARRKARPLWRMVQMRVQMVRVRSMWTLSPTITEEKRDRMLAEADARIVRLKRALAQQESF